MSDISDRYRRRAAALTQRVAAVPADAWDNPSPCDDWTVLGLVRHLVDTHGMFLGFVDRSLGDIPDVDDDPLAAWTAARDVVQANLDDPERAGTEFEGLLGRTTFQQAVDSYLSFDLIVHGWDLARAAGIDETIDPNDVSEAWEQAKAYGDNLRRPGVCGPALDPPEGADEQTRLLAFLGRQAW